MNHTGRRALSGWRRFALGGAGGLLACWAALAAPAALVFAAPVDLSAAGQNAFSRQVAVDTKGTPEKAVSSKRKKPKRGTTFSYMLSKAARVVFTIERKGKGRKVAGKCKKQSGH